GPSLVARSEKRVRLSARDASTGFTPIVKRSFEWLVTISVCDWEAPAASTTEKPLPPAFVLEPDAGRTSSARAGIAGATVVEVADSRAAGRVRAVGARAAPGWVSPLAGGTDPSGASNKTSMIGKPLPDPPRFFANAASSWARVAPLILTFPFQLRRLLPYFKATETACVPATTSFVHGTWKLIAVPGTNVFIVNDC